MQRLRRNLLAALLLASVALEAESLPRLDNDTINAGLDPRDPRLLRLVAYFRANGVQLEYESGLWHAPAYAWHGATVGVSLRTFPEWASTEEMREAISRINLAYALNPTAHIAMSYIGIRGGLDPRDKERVRRLDVRLRLRCRSLGGKNGAALRQRKHAEGLAIAPAGLLRGIAISRLGRSTTKFS